MGRVNSIDLKKLLAFGTGVGIEIGRQDLRVVAARVRPDGAVITGWTVIASFRERAAADWGAEYLNFVKRVGVSHLAATVLLPRSEIIARVLTLPGVPRREMGAAVQYQVDALHPYGDGEAQYAWAHIPGASAALVAIARREEVERYAALFSEAGVRCRAFTFSAAALYSAARLLTQPPDGGFVAVAESGGETEIYGESAARPILTTLADVAAEEAVKLAIAELRIDPECKALAPADLLPKPKAAPEDWDVFSGATAYAAALVGACFRLALPLNLLPAEHRSTSSRAIYIPTAVLASALLILAAGLAAEEKLQERRYLAKLEAEIARLEPQVMKLQRTERAIETIRERVRLLDEFRRRTQSDLDVLHELTKLLEPPTWINTLELTRTTVNIAGETDQAAVLLKMLDQSPFFQNSEFTTPISRTAKGELFRIRSAREGGRQ